MESTAFTLVKRVMKEGLELHMFTIIFSLNPFILSMGYVSVHRPHSVMDGWLAPLLWREKIIKERDGTESKKKARRKQEEIRIFPYSLIWEGHG